MKSHSLKLLLAAMASGELPRLRKIYGSGDWRKRKGFTRVRRSDGSLRDAEIHWYEATGLGKFEFKIKRYTD